MAVYCFLICGGMHMTYYELILNAVFNNLLDIVIAVISISVSYYLIPAIRDQMVPWLKEKHVYDIVYRVVLAAEKLGETNQINKADKKEYVVNILSKKGIAITPEVEQLIETACKELDLLESTTIEAIKDGAENG